MGYGLYLYGIFPLPGPQNLDLQGLDKQPVGTQTVDGFVFLYSEAQQERYLPSRRNLLDHEKVLEAAMQAGDRTLLPLPLNRVIVTDWEIVAQQFTIPHGTDLKQLFEKLEGKREVSVKIFWDEKAELELLMQENDALRNERDRLQTISPSRDQLMIFGQQVEQAKLQRQQDIAEVFRSVLNPLGLEIVENDAQTEAMIYNAAFLIDWDSEPTFAEQVEKLDHQFEGRLRIRYNNFTAPYNFAQLR